MEIKQFEDKNLAHYSYALLSGDEIVLIDPSRDPQAYVQFAANKKSTIVGIIETHPHADFVSGHLELHNLTKAPIYVSELLGADYPHKAVGHKDEILFGECKLQILETPGHSPDSISVLLYDEDEHQHAVFTGDSLFIGDCGRPDLRESVGNLTAKREELAKQMYHTLRKVFLRLEGKVLVYPAHGAGSLCGKDMSNANSSTIKEEKKHNWCLQEMEEALFVQELLASQPYIPKYFAHAVDINKQGASNLKKVVDHIPYRMALEVDLKDEEFDVLIDTRPNTAFNNGHVNGAINLMNGAKFETWLGSIVSPRETFSLVAASKSIGEELVARIAKIGYESQIKQVIIGNLGHERNDIFAADRLTQNPERYAIIDIRNPQEVAQKPLFPNAYNIPLYELREKASTISTEKPIVVHCAGGYRSAAGSSIVRSILNEDAQVHDLSDAVKEMYESHT